LKKEKLSLEVERIYTDHHDDLPLMEYANETYLVGASESTVERVKRIKIKVKLL
jgi:phosphoserine phosphatase